MPTLIQLATFHAHLRAFIEEFAISGGTDHLTQALRELAQDFNMAVGDNCVPTLDPIIVPE